MSNLYHRKLLSDFEVAEIEDALEEAITCVGQQERSVTEREIDALSSRLRLRKALLAAVVLDVNVDERTQVGSWERCLHILPTLLETKDVGKAVESSFSAKIQRRLASSVPPRPVVNVCFEDAHAYLSQLCQNGTEAYRILDFLGPSNLLVGLFYSEPRSRY